MVSVRSAILGVARPRLGQLGFTFVGSPDRGSWEFSREQNGAFQTIAFERSQHLPRALRFIIKSSTAPIGITAESLATETPTGGWWEFTDDGSPYQIMEQLTALVAGPGIRWLERVAKPVPMPSIELRRTLYNNAEDLARLQAVEIGVDSLSPAAISTVENYVLQQQAKSGDADWPLVLRVSAYFGELVRRLHGGSWEWSNETAVLRNIGRNPHNDLMPLETTTVFWFRGDVDRATHLSTVYQMVRSLSRE